MPKRIKRTLATLFVLWAVSFATSAITPPAQGAFSSFQTYQPAAATFTPAWKDLRMGAGGQVTQIYISKSDDTKVIRTDVGGGYLYRATGTCTLDGNSFAAPCWEQLFTTASMPGAQQTYLNMANGNVGLGEIAVCESDTNTAYALFNYKLWVTTNLKATSGRAWTDTGRTTTYWANGHGSHQPEHSPWIYCDPNNKNVVYYSAPSGTGQGTFYTTTGTTNPTSGWTVVSALGVGSSNLGTYFAYDPASSVSGGITQHFWACTYGTGCYETTNGGPAGGGSFTLTTSGPTTFYSVRADKFSQLWVIGESNQVNRYVSSWATITTPTTGSGGPTNIALDFNSASLGANHIAVGSFDGYFANSTDNGVTWNGGSGFFNNQTYSASGSQPPALGTMSQYSAGIVHLNTLGMEFDAAGNLWNAAGVGVWTTPAPLAFNATPWAANSLGIEELVSTVVLGPPGNAPVMGVWDRGIYQIPNPDVFPPVQYPNSTSISQIQGGWGLDYASAGGTTNFLAAWIQSNLDSTNSPAKSTDGGFTWTAWGGQPASVNFGGNIAASTSSNWIVVPGFNRQIYYTLDGGGTFNPSTITGSPTNWVTNTNEGVAIAADRVTAGNYCAVNRSQTFYSSTNQGQNFATTGATSANVDGAPNLAYLKSAPGNAGHFFYTAGGNGAGTQISLWKSTNTCVSWTNVNTNFKPVYNVGFGAHKPGASGTYPTIYAYGVLSGVLGMYQSTDGGTTWALISAPSSQQTFPQTTFDLVQDISGDMDVYGRIYVGFNGNGASYLDTADACPWVKFTSTTKPNDVKTGTISLAAQASGLAAATITAVNFYVDGSLIGTQTSGTGTPTTYSQSWNTGSVGNGAHTLKVEAVGNGCTAGGGGNAQSIPITTN